MSSSGTQCLHTNHGFLGATRCKRDEVLQHWKGYGFKFLMWSNSDNDCIRLYYEVLHKGNYSNNINAASGSHVRTQEEETPEELSRRYAGRAAAHIDRDLQRSLSNNESSALSEEDIPADIAAKRQKSIGECSRGFPAVLQNLVQTYQSVGRHCWLCILYCVIQYLYTYNAF